MKIDDIHDSHVLMIEYQPQSKRLIIRIKTEDELIVDLSFDGAIGWIFSPFEAQNILFSANIYGHDNLPDNVWDEWEGLKAYAAAIKEHNASIAILYPSVGFGGVILFTGSSPFL